MLSAGETAQVLPGRRAGGWRRVGQVIQAEAVGDRLGQVLVDVEQAGHHPRADAGPVALAQLEGERVGDVLLLDRGLAEVELPGLAVVVGEALRPQPPLRARLVGRVAAEPALAGSSRGPPSSAGQEFGS